MNNTSPNCNRITASSIMIVIDIFWLIVIIFIAKSIISFWFKVSACEARLCFNVAGFPNVIGVIDCTHIPIFSIGKDYAEKF
jgi:hypothetical protein